MKELILASAGALTAAERRLLKFADWMGVPTRTLMLAHEPARGWGMDTRDGDRDCLALSANTLAAMHAASPEALHAFIRQRCAQVLVFGCTDRTDHSRAVSWLTHGVVRDIEPPAPGDDLVDLPAPARHFSDQLAGLTFSTGRPLAVPAFDLSACAPAVDTIMRMSGRPVFVRIAAPESELFLLAVSDIPDVDEPLSKTSDLDAFYDRLIPLLVYLRHSFGAACWHGPRHTAHLIIDDPLLAEAYGFLDYRALLASMQRERYATSVAFIPWNHKRTSRRVASSLFGGRADFSLCVHGCDHSDGEFDVLDDGPRLEHKAGLALDRMQRHQTRTGLSFERIMVFPQGRFTRDAMLALRAADYLAAVDTMCFPTDCASGTLTLGDFLRPAITRFYGFPVFQRRYPRRLVDSAFDLFLGKPALLAEHHELFRDGCAKLEDFVRSLYGVEPALSWPTLSSQFTRTCLQRLVAPRSVEVEFFTKDFHLENTSGEPRSFRLTKDEPNSFFVRAVVADGVPVPFGFNKTRLEFELELDAGQATRIEVLDQRRPSRPSAHPRLIYNTRVLARRRLSEFRDNTLARHPRLLHLARRLARGVGVISSGVGALSSGLAQR